MKLTGRTRWDGTGRDGTGRVGTGGDGSAGHTGAAAHGERDEQRDEQRTSRTHAAGDEDTDGNEDGVM